MSTGFLFYGFGGIVVSITQLLDADSIHRINILVGFDLLAILYHSQYRR